MLEEEEEEEDGWMGSLNGLTLRAPNGANNIIYIISTFQGRILGGQVNVLQFTQPLSLFKKKIGGGKIALWWEQKVQMSGGKCDKLGGGKRYNGKWTTTSQTYYKQLFCYFYVETSYPLQDMRWGKNFGQKVPKVQLSTYYADLQISLL